MSLNIIGRLEQLTREERRALRTQARMLRKLANGIALCGAMTRQGRPCVATALKNGRCKNHGGRSTGPKTEEGRTKSLAALRQYREKRKPEKMQNGRITNA